MKEGGHSNTQATKTETETVQISDTTEIEREFGTRATTNLERTEIRE